MNQQVNLEMNVPPGKLVEDIHNIAPTPPAADDVYVMPATQGQVRFWSLDQLNPGNPGLNMPLMWSCSGPLDVELLAAAFSEAVRRHEMLRTTFDMVDGRLAQLIGPPYQVQLSVDDLQHLPDPPTSPEAGHLIRAHAAYRMDLRNGPLLVIKLLKYAPEHHLLLVTMHHIICDGISLGILLRDIAVFYEALAEDKIPQLPELPIQFADYAVWQEEWRQSDAAKVSMEFWRKTLGNDLSPIHLRRDPPLRKRKDQGFDTDSENGDIETLLISPKLTAAAHQFCIRENVTFNILLFSVFCALLRRLTGLDDISVGSPCANRTEESEELIGLFMNIQILRVKIEQGESFRSLLRKVQEWTLGAYENQELPFEELIFDPFFAEGNNSFEVPLFFLYQKSFMLTQRVAGLEITPVRSMSPGAVFDVMFAIVDRPEEGPRLQFEYNPQHFRAATVQRYLRMYIRLLESFVEQDGAVAVDELAILGEGELEELTEADGDGSRFEPTEITSTPNGDREIQPDAGAPQAFVPPRDMIERQLSEMWQTTLNIPKISIRANFFSLGVGSLAALRLITKMNRFYGIDLGLASLIHASTIESVAELVRTRFSPNTMISLVPIQPHGTLPPLFIVHGVGGNVVNFYGLSQRMGRDQPVYGIQSQALVSSQAALLRLEDMAAYYLKEVRQVQPEGPYHFLGYSFGGTVVLEIAHQLRAKGQEVALLGMLDSKSREYQRAWTKAKPFQGRINQRMDLFRNNTGHLDWSNRLAYFREKVLTRTIRFSCMAAAVCKIKKVPSFMKSAYDINYVAIQNYQLRPYPGRMTLFRATEQDDPLAPRALGWDAIFSGGVEDIPLPGDHERIFLEPGIEVLATRLRECLNKK
jgi:thioesterase domain-containing protein